MKQTYWPLAAALMLLACAPYWAQTPTPANPWEPHCVSASEPHHELIYATVDPADPHYRPPRYFAMKTQIRKYAQWADEHVTREAAVVGANGMQIPFLCDAGGRPIVHKEINIGMWPGHKDALRARGHDDPNAIYWLFADLSTQPQLPYADFCDAGPPPYDASSPCNQGNRYAVWPAPNLDSAGPQFIPPFHEVLHVMGAVQTNAPHHEGGKHCWDGRDVMCPLGKNKVFPPYIDTSVCPWLPNGQQAIDCHKDDYFNPCVPPSQGVSDAFDYLRSNWNIGADYNVWLHHPGCTTEVTECNDGIDNDGDGLIDYGLDHGCSGLPDDDEGDDPECDDGLDNDGDGLVDVYTDLYWSGGTGDPGCILSWDREEGANPHCTDGINNDSDSWGADWPLDPGCVAWNDSDENGGEPQCADGVDNEPDGFTDWPADPECSTPYEFFELFNGHACSDMIDNDRDGLVDWLDDPDCTAWYDQSE